MIVLRKILDILLPKTRLNNSLRVLVASNTVMVFAIGLFAPFYAVFVKNIGGSLVFAGFSWSLLYIVSGVLILLFTKWELKVKEQELLLALGYVLRGFVFLSYAFMDNMTQLILTQVVWGIAAAIGTPAFDSVYSSHVSQDKSIMQWGQWEGLAAIATGTAALIGGILIENFGYEIIFMVMAGISFLLGAYIWRLPRDVL